MDNRKRGHRVAHGSSTTSRLAGAAFAARAGVRAGSGSAVSEIRQSCPAATRDVERTAREPVQSPHCPTQSRGADAAPREEARAATATAPRAAARPRARRRLTSAEWRSTPTAARSASRGRFRAGTGLRIRLETRQRREIARQVGLSRIGRRRRGLLPVHRRIVLIFGARFHGQRTLELDVGLAGLSTFSTALKRPPGSTSIEIPSSRQSAAATATAMSAAASKQGVGQLDGDRARRLGGLRIQNDRAEDVAMDSLKDDERPPRPDDRARRGDELLSRDRQRASEGATGERTPVHTNPPFDIRLEPERIAAIESGGAAAASGGEDSLEDDLRHDMGCEVQRPRGNETVEVMIFRSSTGRPNGNDEPAPSRRPSLRRGSHGASPARCLPRPSRSSAPSPPC